MSSTASRAEKFLTDAETILSTNPIKAQKISSEVQKLCKWLQKHQDIAIPDNYKNKLFTCVQKYYNFASKKLTNYEKDETQNDVRDQILELCEDMCKLPEGKLIAGRAAKTKVMKWIDDLQDSGVQKNSEFTEKHENSGLHLSVIDNQNGVITAMNEETGETFEFQEIVPDEFVTAFDEGQLCVKVSNDCSEIISFYVEN